MTWVTAIFFVALGIWSFLGFGGLERVVRTITENRVKALDAKARIEEAKAKQLELEASKPKEIESPRDYNLYR